MTVGLNRSEKAVVIEEVAAKVASAKSIVLAQYRGLEVGHITGLRVMRAERACICVCSRTRWRVARSQRRPFAGLADQMVGPLIYGISDDPVAAAKVISEFAKTNDKLVVKAGSLPNSVFDAAGVKALATMPSREELLAKLLGTMQAPIAQFVRTLNEVPTKFVRALAAVRDQKQTAARRGA